MTDCLGVFQEDANRGKPNWEHLADDLHVLLTVEDTENRAKIKLARAVEEVKRLLIPVSFFLLLTCTLIFIRSSTRKIQFSTNRLGITMNLSGIKCSLFVLIKSYRHCKRPNRWRKGVIKTNNTYTNRATKYEKPKTYISEFGTCVKLCIET